MMHRSFFLTVAAVALLAAPAISHAAAGDLDPSWGGLNGEIPGTVATDLGSGIEDEGFAAAIQPDGKIVVAGYTSNGEFALIRYNTDGSLDTSFGGSGSEAPGTTVVDSACVSSTHFGTAHSVVIQPDGKILVGGFEDVPGCHVGFAVMRFTSDGKLDTGFGGQNGDTAGTSTASAIDFGATRGFALALQPATNAEGFKIIVVGDWQGGEGGYDYALARMNPDGTLDSTFAQGDSESFEAGTRLTNFQSPCERADQALAVAIDANGRLVVVGWEEDNVDFANSKGTDLAIARYTVDGALDTTFHPGGTDGAGPCAPATRKGTVMTDLEGKDDQAHAVAIQPDGHILVAGFATQADNHKSFVVVRYNSDGSVDTTWGTNGHVYTDFSGIDSEANAIAVLSDGKFIVSGSTYHGAQSQDGDFAMARYNADGTLDSTFGTGGKVQTNFAGNGNDNAESMLIQPDGKIVLAGWRSHSPPDFAVARYLTDPKPTPPAPTPVVINVPSSNPPASCGDTTNPVVKIASLQHRTLYARGGKATVKITATDNGTLATDPSKSSLTLSTQRAGRHTVTATAVDACGNRGTGRFSYRVVAGPNIRITSPTSCVRSSVSATVSISGGAALRQVVVMIGGRRVFDGVRKRIRVSAETSLLTPTRHRVAVFVRDAAGHRRHAFANFTVCPAPAPLFTG